MALADGLEVLLAGCERVLQGDAAFIAQLRARGFTCASGYWAFRLPELHAWLNPALDYRPWRQRLYASDLNTRLRAFGAEIAIAENRGKTDANLYCLQLL
ncbi:hypothetical protein D9M68_403390 [compost metagenome]